MKLSLDNMFGVILLGLIVCPAAYIFYLPTVADQSDCPAHERYIADMLDSRAIVFNLSEHPERDRCAAYRAHLNNLEKVRAISLRCFGWVGKIGRAGIPRLDGPNDLTVEEDYYRRLISEKCGG